MFIFLLQNDLPYDKDSTKELKYIGKLYLCLSLYLTVDTEIQLGCMTSTNDSTQRSLESSDNEEQLL